MTAAKLARAAARLNAGLLALMTDDNRLPDPVAAARALPKGSLVIIRARDAKRRRALAETLSVKTTGLILLAADDPVLANQLHGLHLPEAHARDAAHWRALRPHWVITVAAHSARALHAPYADAALLSPVFATRSHPKAHPLTPARARLIARASLVPVLALGGVNERNAALLSGFSGIAAIDGLNV
ncbi:MAG TPA: thiamine phosphate synthase [Rhizomicrobium sp.]|nr:thiamine phosphate synthase [Rhizomicrobium sp.]